MACQNAAALHLYGTEAQRVKDQHVDVFARRVQARCPPQRRMAQKWSEARRTTSSGKGFVFSMRFSALVRVSARGMPAPAWTCTSGRERTFSGLWRGRLQRQAVQRILSSTLVLTTEVATKGLALNWLRMYYVDNVCCGMRVISSARMVFATHHILSCDSRLCPNTSTRGG